MSGLARIKTARDRALKGDFTEIRRDAPGFMQLIGFMHAMLYNNPSWTLLGHLFIAIGSYGKPKSVRTDNEAVFCSKLFRMMLYVCGIRHQTTDLHCPWQNGRIERFFGSLKEKMDQVSVASFEALNLALREYRFWYNHVRPHQNLNGATPADAWAGVDPYKDGYKKEYWFEAWEGLLQGFYLRR